MNDTPTTKNQQLITVLQVEGLSVNYGMVEALKDVSFTVGEGEIVALLGPNGAGKSTALKTICGLLDAYYGEITSGKISYLGEKINGTKPYDLVKKGLCLVPEGRRVFTTMTVKENLEMGGYTVVSDSLLDVGKPTTKNQQPKTRMGKVYDLFPVLKERRKQRAGTLSSGEQQMLAIGRALMLKPKLLLLDEPSLGLSPNYVTTVFEKLHEINKEGTTILLVEQNVRKALQYAHRAYVFKIGTIAFKGTPDHLRQTKAIEKTYLGR